jgi:hypothetical protein
VGKNVFPIKHEYSNIDFSALTDSELTELIKRAMTEFQNRLNNPVFENRREVHIPTQTDHDPVHDSV